MRFKLEKVRYIPAHLQPDILYVSKEFGIAVHLCACGCGSKIRTPLGPTEWSVRETRQGPTLRPSIGNWQERCQSHYLICRGEVKWADRWSQEQIAAGRKHEEQRRTAYFESRSREHRGLVLRFLHWMRGLFLQR